MSPTIHVENSRIQTTRWARFTCQLHLSVYVSTLYLDILEGVGVADHKHIIFTVATQAALVACQIRGCCNTKCNEMSVKL